MNSGTLQGRKKGRGGTKEEEIVGDKGPGEGKIDRSFLLPAWILVRKRDKKPPARLPSAAKEGGGGEERKETSPFDRLPEAFLPLQGRERGGRAAYITFISLKKEEKGGIDFVPSRKRTPGSHY